MAQKQLSARSIPNYRLYGDPDTDLTCEPVHVDDISVSSRKHQWYVEPHRHDDLLQLVFFRQGRCSFQLEENQYQLNSPVFILIPPTAVHSFQMSLNQDGDLVTVTADFADKLLSPSPALKALVVKPLLLEGKQHEAFLQETGLLFSQLRTEYNERQLARNLTLKSLIALFFSKLIRHQDQSGSQENSWGVENPGQWYYRQFQNLIGKNLSQKTPITEYAVKLRISATHLNRVCREVAQMSALDVVHQRMVKEAKRSLAYTVLSVSEVGYHLGFGDPSYFSRFFKSQTGLSPKDYQARVRKVI